MRTAPKFKKEFSADLIEGRVEHTSTFTENEQSEFSDSYQQKPMNYSVYAEKLKQKMRNLKFVKADMQRNLPFKPSSNSFIMRSLYILIMILGFQFILTLGHTYCSMFVFIINLGIYYEMMSMRTIEQIEKQLPSLQIIKWYIYLISAQFFYGKLFISKLNKFIMTYKFIELYFKYHNLISFGLYLIGLLIFIKSLNKKDQYKKYQISQFGLNHFIILLIVSQGAFITLNIYEGLIWFVMPCVLVQMSDVSGCIIGILFGKHNLFSLLKIQLKNEKTLEGFIGSIIVTAFSAFYISQYLQQSQELTCTQFELTFYPFDFPKCETLNIYIPMKIELPSIFSTLFDESSIYISQFQIHSMIMGLFANLIVPFGGFIGSKAKQALKTKSSLQQESTIPDWLDGITDRIDCQLIMGMFTYVYLHQVVIQSDYLLNETVKVIIKLPVQDQLKMYEQLKLMIQ